MIASESTALLSIQRSRPACTALQQALDSPAQTMPDRGATLISSMTTSAPMLPRQLPLISIQPYPKQTTHCTRHHATHN